MNPSVLSEMGFNLTPQFIGQSRYSVNVKDHLRGVAVMKSRMRLYVALVGIHTTLRSTPYITHSDRDMVLKT